MSGASQVGSPPERMEAEPVPPDHPRAGPNAPSLNLGSIFEQLKVGMDLLRGIRDFIRWSREKDIEQENTRRRHSFHVLLTLMGFLGAIILGMSALVYFNKVSGDALLFLVGTVAGWILFTVQRHLFESEPDDDGGSLLGGLSP